MKTAAALTSPSVDSVAALVSVYDKSKLAEFVRKLKKKIDCQIIASGGSSQYLHNENIDVTQLSKITQFDEILDGRVKTLHPKIYAALLAKRNDKAHLETIKKLQVPDIRIVCVNLYPFAEKVRQNATPQDIIENIDIGGVTLIRAAAKNYHSINILTNPEQYQLFLEQIDENNQETSIAFREKLAQDAFAYTALYEADIANYFARKQQYDNKEKMPPFLIFAGKKKNQLKYGENPSQSAAIYTNDNNTKFNFQDIDGKNLSYNNIKDIDTAIKMVSVLAENQKDDAVCVVVKHSNPCGCAIDKDAPLACQKAIEADKISAFGGIIACNKIFDEKLALKIEHLFVEVLVAKKFTPKARKILATRKNIRLVEAQFNSFDGNLPLYEINNVANGDIIAQTKLKIHLNADNIKRVTKKCATDKQIQDMLFAYNVVAQTISNAIVIASEQQTCSIAGGQTNRIDAVKIALEKSKEKISKVLASKVLASDAFFPFDDAIKIMAKYDIKAVIQPGGSIRDEQVIKAADENGIAMYFTQQRVFRH